MIGLYISHGRDVPDAIRIACLRQLANSDLAEVFAVATVETLPDIAEALTGHMALTLIDQECVRPCLLDRWHRILQGLEEIAKIHDGCEAVYLLEHDVWYPTGYAMQDRVIGPGAVSYAPAIRLTRRGWADAKTLSSTACGTLSDLLAVARKRCESLEAGERIKWDEPGRDPRDKLEMHLMVYASDPDAMLPAVDIRHGGNYTGDRTAQYTHSPEYGDFADFWKRFLGDEVTK